VNEYLEHEIKSLNESALSELESQDPLYLPTNFWGPGVTRLLEDLGKLGLSSFKSWPTSRWWFYPVYGSNFTNATIKLAYEAASEKNPAIDQIWTSGALNGGQEARRDFDCVRLAWDQERWPFDLEGQGESLIGKPPQRYRMTDNPDIGWGRGYLNYLLCLSALSQHVEEVPRSFLEIGGGFGVLGEIVISRDSSANYVDLDIPPLHSVASYYLASLLGRENVVLSSDVPSSGELNLTGKNAVLPSWRMPDVRGSFDVFVNSFSFQEMEPDVVKNYLSLVANLNVKYIVSLNSFAGKPSAANHEIGVLDAVTNQRIVDWSTELGYSVSDRYRSPLLKSAGELVVLKRD
jgi:putative sugar O-methyltransferase